MRRTALASAALVLLTTFFTGNPAGPAGASTGSGDLAPLGPDFLWGTASAGFQSEGYSPVSNWSRYATASKYDTVGSYESSVLTTARRRSRRWPSR